jgi:SAM-dependent methyltransferase
MLAEQAPLSRPLAVPKEADVKAWSHAILDAYDRGELTPLEIALSPQFVHFEDGQASSREELLTRIRERDVDAARIGSRELADEKVVTGPQGAVFIGKAIEHSTGNEVHGGDEFVGFYKLVWVPAGERYQLLFWSWQLGGRAATRAFWDERYRNATGFNKEPNQLLMSVTSKLTPGVALDLAMGQGRNALYLAAEGWDVTGVDFSAEATRQAREQANARELELEVLQEDINSFDFGVAKYDLVTMLYATDNVDWIARSQRSLKRGGVFVYEFFQNTGKGVDSARLAALFRDGFEILRNDVIRGTPDWTRSEATLLQFVAKKR